MSRSTPQFKRLLYYVLMDGKPVPADLQTVEAFLENIDKRRVDDTSLYTPDGTRVDISTVFLCVDHCMDDGPPVLWETMIFWPGNDKLDNWQQRYTSDEIARAGHQEAVALVKAALDSTIE